jgi:hypothetical protein
MHCEDNHRHRSLAVEPHQRDTPTILLPKGYAPVKAPLSGSVNILPIEPIEGGRR